MLTMQQLAASRMASNMLIYRGITLPTDVTEYRTATEYISAKFIPRRDSSSAVDMTSGHLDPSDQIAVERSRCALQSRHEEMCGTGFRRRMSGSV
jgi:hypothetical protein